MNIMKKLIAALFLALILAGSTTAYSFFAPNQINAKLERSNDLFQIQPKITMYNTQVNQEGIVINFGIRGLNAISNSRVQCYMNHDARLVLDYPLRNVQNGFNSKLIIGDAIGFTPREFQFVRCSLKVCTGNTCVSKHIPLPQQ